METDRKGARQTAYRVRVSSDAEILQTPDLWDSGLVESDQSVFVPDARAELAKAGRTNGGLLAGAGTLPVHGVSDRRLMGERAGGWVS